MDERDPLIGTTLGRYRIEALHRRSTLASVYRAVDTTFARTVAIKVIDRELAGDPGFVTLFLREGRALARLQHPHILPVFDVGEAPGIAYLVMPYIQGGSLRDRFDDRPAAPALSAAAAVALLRPIAAALDYAHGQGIIHRDVKPSNILLDEFDTPFLADFSLARLVQDQGQGLVTFAGMRPGTPEYMSPELGQARPLDGRSDLYSLAVVLYEALTGRPPFRAESPSESPVAVIIRHATAPPPAPRGLNPAIPASVEAVLLRALAKSPDDRYPTGAALFTALADALQAPSIAAAEGGPAAGALLPAGRPGTAPDEDRLSRPAVGGALLTGAVADNSPAVADAEVVATPMAGPDGADDRAAGVALTLPDDPARGTTDPRAARGAWSGAPDRRADRRLRRLGLLAGALLTLLLGGFLVGTLLPTLGGRGPEPPTPLAATQSALGTVQAAIPATAPVTLPVTAPTAAPARAAGTPATLAAGTPASLATMPSTPTRLPAPTAAPPPPGTAVAVAASPGAGRQEVILYAADRGGVAGAQVYVMRPDGREQQQLITAGGPAAAPRLAPDGRSFFFSVAPRQPAGAVPAAPSNHYIYIARSDGSAIDELTNRPSFNSAWSWSPDGRWIALVSDRDGNWEIYRVGPTGEGLTRLTNGPARDGWPVWTPDGRSIIFVSDRDGQPQLYRMDADGANPRRLVSSETRDLDPAVAPDGRKLVFSAQAHDGRAGDLVIINLDGSDPVRLTTGAGMNIHPAWSPDGRRIVFASNRDGNFNLYVMNADGSGQARLTEHAGDDLTPSWGFWQPR